MRQVPLRPSMTLPEAFATAVGTAGGTRLVADGEQLTLRELAGRAETLASGLARAGVRPGDHVGLLLPNGVGYAEAFFAVLVRGAVVVPLDPGLTDRELTDVREAVGIGALVSDRAGRPAARGLVEVVAADGSWQVPEVGPAASPGPARGRRDVAAVFLTSGTTGRPKPVPLTHHELVRPLIALQRLHAAFFSGSPVASARRVATVVARHGRRLLRAAGRQTWLTTSPFRSMAGHQVLAGSLLLGHHLVTSRTFTPRHTLELVDDHDVNVLAATPAVLELLLRVGDLAPYDLSSLLVIGVGGGPAAADLVERARRRFGCAVTIGYGSTELGGGVLATRLEDPPETQSSTVGRPFPGAAVRVVAEDGGEAPPGVPGELLARPAGAPEDAPLLRTGDLAVRDEAGNVRILGRSDDLIVRAAQNVHPGEVERVIAELPAVERCAVVGVPHRVDQQVWAFVVPGAGQDVRREDVLAHCRSALSPPKRPDRIRFVSELPVNEYGEVRRRDLRERAAAESATGETGGTGGTGGGGEGVADG